MSGGALLCLLLVILGAARPTAAHGHLLLPVTRELKNGVRLPNGRTFIEDEYAPINLKGDGMPEVTRRPVMDPDSHPDGASFVCDISNANARPGQVSQRTRSACSPRGQAISWPPYTP